MDRQKAKQIRRARRVTGIRKRVVGTPDRPRLAVYRSLKHVYAQVIDDYAGHTLASASSRDASLGVSSTGNIEAAKAVGAKIAELAKARGVDKVVFDRRGARFHGRGQAGADAARNAGLEF